MAVQLQFTPNYAFGSGVFEPGAKVSFFLSGTTTPVTVYSDEALTSAHPVPLEADASGQFATVWAANGVNVKAVVTDADDAAMFTIDKVVLGNTSIGQADTVGLDPVSGLASTDVQEAVEELHSLIMTNEDAIDTNEDAIEANRVAIVALQTSEEEANDPPDLADFTTFQYIAHRGAPAINPEQTVAAYEWCAANGYQLIEGDVRFSSDDSAVLYHDDTLTALSGSAAAVSSLRLGQLKTYGVAGFGSLLGDGQPITSLSEMIQARQADSIFFLEAKVDGAEEAIVGELNARGIGTGQAVISSFDRTRLEVPTAGGWTTEWLIDTTASTSVATTNVATAVSANIDRICINANHSDAIVSEYTSGALDVFFYTLHRRDEIARAVSLGVSGAYVDDPEYTSTTTQLYTTDKWERCEWMPGMVAQGESLDAIDRGRLFEGGWGWPTTDRPVSADGTTGVLQGWGCPLVDDTATDTFSVEFSVRYDSLESTGRWFGFALADTSMGDGEFIDNASTPADQSWLLFFCRQNGEMKIFKQDAGSATDLGTGTSASITTGTTAHFRVTVTPTLSTFERLDAAGGTPTTIVTTSDTDIRGAYFHFASSGAAGLFTDVNIT